MAAERPARSALRRGAAAYGVDCMASNNVMLCYVSAAPAPSRIRLWPNRAGRLTIGPMSSGTGWAAAALLLEQDRQGCGL